MIFLGPFFIFFITFNLYPILNSFFISLTDWNGIGEKVFIGLNNYIRIISNDVNFRKSLLNTIYIIFIANPLILIIGLLLANFLYGINQGRTVFQTINFLPYITTPVALGLIFSFLFDRGMGTVNEILKFLEIVQEGIYWLGSPRFAPWVLIILIVWKYTGYYMAIFLAGLTSVPEELYEAATIDGAGKATSFFFITLPMLKPIISFATITSFIGGLQVFDEPYLLFFPMFGGPERSVLTVVWNFYDISFRSSFRLGYGSAIAFVLFVIIMLVSALGTMLFGKKED
jgi:multiple sugar transport system permease protein/cellobiose transport system permease protein